jgi:hypothetical protein
MFSPRFQSHVFANDKTYRGENEQDAKVQDREPVTLNASIGDPGRPDPANPDVRPSPNIQNMNHSAKKKIVSKIDNVK